MSLIVKIVFVFFCVGIVKAHFFEDFFKLTNAFIENLKIPNKNESDATSAPNMPQEEKLHLSIIQAKWLVRNGINGITSAHVKPTQKMFLIEDGRKFKCLDNSEKCLNKIPYDVKSAEDLCIFHSHISVINDMVCIPFGEDGVIITVTTNKVMCESTKGGDIIMMGQSKFQEMCNKVGKYITYTFTTKDMGFDPDDTLKCQISGMNKICFFTEKLCLHEE